MVSCIWCGKYSKKRIGGFWDYDKELRLFSLCESCQAWEETQYQNWLKEKKGFAELENTKHQVCGQDCVTIQTPIIKFSSLNGLNKQNKPQVKFGLVVYTPIRGITKPTNPPENSKLPDTPTLEVRRKELLQTYRQKQPFRVSIGKSKWVDYETFNPNFNLREILNDEIVIEFDSTDQELVSRAISQTGLNLFNAGYVFEFWEHCGKSPHLHLHNLPIGNLDASKRATFKKLFIRKYVPLEYLNAVDFSLTGIHLIALEWANHWKGCYGIKKLISVFDGQNKTSYGVCG